MATMVTSAAPAMVVLMNRERIHRSSSRGARRAKAYRACIIDGSMKQSSRTLSLVEARRFAMAAQGFARPRLSRPATALDVTRTARSLGLLQIDSVNVLVRSHYLPAFSRLGSYDHDLLDGSAYSGRNRRLFEYWGHEASLIPIEMQPLFRWRMERARRGVGTWGGVARFGRERKEFCRDVLEQIRERGLPVFRLQSRCASQGGWWGWSEGGALEWLFWVGHVSTHSRRKLSASTISRMKLPRPSPRHRRPTPRRRNGSCCASRPRAGRGHGA
jgi:uncharacterized protein YcaQ